MKKKEITKEELRQEIENYLKILYRKTIDEADNQQVFQALSYALKDDIVDKWMATHKQYEKLDSKTVYYLSMEFLTGRALGNIIINLKADKVVRETLEEIGFDLDAIEDEEPDAALGNGGLGRLAACFLDSLSCLGYPAYGCGSIPVLNKPVFSSTLSIGFSINKYTSRTATLTAKLTINRLLLANCINAATINAVRITNTGLRLGCEILFLKTYIPAMLIIRKTIQTAYVYNTAGPYEYILPCTGST